MMQEGQPDYQHSAVQNRLMSIMMITTKEEKARMFFALAVLRAEKMAFHQLMPSECSRSKASATAACLVASDLLARTKAMTTAMANVLARRYIPEMVIQGLWKDEKETNMKV